MSITDDTRTDHAAEPAARALPPLPDSVLRPGRAAARSWARRGVACAAIAAVGATAFVIVGRRRSDAATALSTATAGSAEITSTFSSVATIEPVDQATVGFPTGGTVTSVEVAAGDSVAIGDVLATLDTADLEQALRSAEADLADARNVLATAVAGDDPSSLLGGGGGGGFAGVGLSGGGVVFAYASAIVEPAGAVLVAAGAADVAAAQQAVITAQAAVDEATATAAAALDSAVSVCATVQTDITPLIDPDDPTAPIVYPTGTIVACRSALDAAIAAQQAVSTRQTELAGAAGALGELLDRRAAELAGAADSAITTTTTAPAPEPTTATTTTAAPTTPGVTDAPATSEPSADAGFGGSGGGSGGAPSGGGGGSSVEDYQPTAEELMSYQSSVDAATYAVAAAEQAIAQATIVSPITGTVTSVDFTVGDEVSAATEAVVVRGEGGMEATTTVSLDQVEQIEVGQPATVTPDGSAEVVTGQVVAIGITPDSASTTTSFRVTIGFDGGATELRNGNLGEAEITVATAAAATAVPTSAVKLDTRGSYVTVVAANGTTARQSVQIGVVGARWTEITSGLEAGQVVALNDPPAG